MTNIIPVIILDKDLCVIIFILFLIHEDAITYVFIKNNGFKAQILVVEAYNFLDSLQKIRYNKLRKKE